LTLNLKRMVLAREGIFFPEKKSKEVVTLWSRPLVQHGFDGPGVPPYAWKVWMEMGIFPPDHFPFPHKRAETTTFDQREFDLEVEKTPELFGRIFLTLFSPKSINVEQLVKLGVKLEKDFKKQQRMESEFRERWGAGDDSNPLQQRVLWGALSQGPHTARRPADLFTE
jgi:hypothetical protein